MPQLDSSYRICWTAADWVEATRMALDSSDIGLDFETCPDRRREFTTSTLRPELGARVCGTALSWLDPDGNIQSAYAACRHHQLTAGGRQLLPQQVFGPLDDLIRALSDDQCIVVANAGMELQFLLAEGVAWPKPGQFQDIQIACRVLNKGVGFQELIGLKPLQQAYLKRDMKSKTELDEWLISRKMKPGRDIWKAPVAIAGWYAQDDSRDTLQIWRDWKSLVYQRPTRWWWHRAPDKRQRHDLHELEMEAAAHSVINCLRGTRIDVKLCRRRAAAATKLQDVCRDWVRAYMDMPTINPGSATQMRGILFSDSIGFKMSPEHLTDSFKKMSERDQANAWSDPKEMLQYASLDIEALHYYGQQNPKHADLTFMLAVYRKCTTAITWFEATVDEFWRGGCPDPWWGEDPHDWLHLIFHRLRTVGTLSGRMSSSDYNGQQVPKRFKMILDVERLVRLLAEFLELEDLHELAAMLDASVVSNSDESKAVGLPIGAPVVDLSVRGMFIPRPGHNIRSLDLSQIELRGFANLTANPLLCQGYGLPPSDEYMLLELSRLMAVADGSPFDPTGLDLERHLRADEEDEFDAHDFIAKQLGISRKAAKGINFGIIYGMGQKKLARSLGWSQDEGKQYLGDYHQRFPEIQLTQNAIKAKLRDRGYVFDQFGRRYYLPMAKSYVGLNRLIQGWAASIFKAGYVRTCEVLASLGGGSIDPITRRRSSDGARVMSVIHDELFSEIHKELDTPETDYMVRTCLTAFVDLRVRLGASSEVSDECWDKVHKYEPRKAA